MHKEIDFFVKREKSFKGDISEICIDYFFDFTIKDGNVVSNKTKISIKHRNILYNMQKMVKLFVQNKQLTSTTFLLI